MARSKLTARKRVIVAPPTVPLLEWMDQLPQEFHSNGAGYYFPDKLWELQLVLGYHERAEYVGIRTPERDGGYSGKVCVNMYEKAAPDGFRRVRRTHEATAPRSTSGDGMEDAARQALSVLCHEEESMRHSQYKYFPHRPSGNLDETVDSSRREDDLRFRYTVGHVRALSAFANHALEDLADSAERIEELEEEIRQLKAVQAGEAMEDEPLEAPPPVQVPPRSPSRQELLRRLEED